MFYLSKAFKKVSFTSVTYTITVKIKFQNSICTFSNYELVAKLMSKLKPIFHLQPYTT